MTNARRIRYGAGTAPRPRPRRRKARARALLFPLALSLTLGGCGFFRAIGSPDAEGFGETDLNLRRRLMVGGFDAALADLEKAAPKDPLLRDLYVGVVAHYAGRYEESSMALERAAELAEERHATQSLARAAFSTLTSDLLLSYEPAEAERLLIHYYGALNYVRRGMHERAAVEARRLAKLLEEYEDRGVRRGLLNAPAMRMFVAAVFAAAGERNDAEVAYRQALHLAGDSTLAAPLPRDSMAEVVVFLEMGFAPYRAEQSLNVLLSGDDVEVFGGEDGEAKAARAGEIAARVLSTALRDQPRYHEESAPTSIFVDAPAQARSKPVCSSKPERSAAAPRRTQAIPASTGSTPPVRHPQDSTRKAEPPPAPAPEGGKVSATSESSGADEPGCGGGSSEGTPYLLRMAWPVFVQPHRGYADARISVGEAAAPLALRADVGGAVIDDFASRHTQLLARTVARAAAKAALTQALENKVSEKDEGVGKLVGLLTNASTAALERADTRSWHLLPGSIGVARVRVPAGSHEVAVTLGSGAYERRVVVGPAETRAGSVTIVSTRVWQ